MRYFKTILFVRNTLFSRGILSFLKQLVPEHDIEVYDKIMYTVDADDPVFILERDIIPDPPEFSLGQLKKNFPESGVIMLSPKVPSDKLRPYLDEYILYIDPEEVISGKIRNLYSGRTEPENTGGQNSVISDREREVLRQVALGHTNKEISDTLCISPHTVITHRKNITAKLGIKTIAGLTVYAVLNGIISADELNGANSYPER